MYQSITLFIRDLAVWLTLVCLIIVFGMFLRSRRHTNRPRKACNNHRFTSQDPPTCRLIIAGKPLEFNNEQYRTSNPNESKAIPNHQLKVSFGIDNSFTREHSHHAASFVSIAKSRIYLSSQDWFDISHYARTTAQNWINNGFSNLGQDCGPMSDRVQTKVSRFNVADLVQVLTMRMVLHRMFKKTNQEEISDLNILSLAKSINRVWISSKNTEKKVPRFEDDAQLQQAIFDVFKLRDIDPGNNPLDLILPSFETMWRVVLRAALEIGLRTGTEHPAWRKAIVAFSMAPTKDQFEELPSSSPPTSTSSSSKLEHQGEKGCVGTPSAKHLMLEALRLYAPTRRVHRAYLCPRNPALYEILSADIEGCHLRPDIWGDDASKFNPSRWLSLTPAQKEAFMPFGSAPFQCPTNHTFGPRMIGLLVGALLEALDSLLTVRWILECEDETVLGHLKTGERLRPDRSSYGDLYLTRVETREDLSTSK